jgi:RNA polymerase sigma factor (sigma-70 family)
MSEPRDDGQRLVAGLRAGDPVVVREFCEGYGAALHRLAERHLGPGLHRRLGPEDVVQSACRTFLRRARGGQYQLGDGQDLWGLLCAITLTKIREQARFHRRRKRSLDREMPLEAGAGDGPCRDLADPGPTPDEAVEFADLFGHVLANLDEEERRLVDLKLQDDTNEEAAERLGCSERTVRRLFKRVRARLLRACEGP